MKLIVHIGNGKTGSTSIQNTLENARQLLLENSVCYLGRMLEFARTDVVKDWQTPAGAELLLHQMSDEDATCEIAEVLRAELQLLQDTEIGTAIWSNEALFARNKGVIPALKLLQSEGVDVSVLVYLRRHDRWAQSAYAQWGIRHKSYQGRVKTFPEWVAERPPRFGPCLEAWNAAFGEALEVGNFDAVEDVVQDFLMRLKLPNLDNQRAYQTPSVEELLVHAAYNDQFPGVVLPEAFQRFCNANGNILPSVQSAARLTQLMPKGDALSAMLENSTADIDAVNTILTDKGERPLFVDQADKKSPDPNIWAIVIYLLQLNFFLQKRLSALEVQIARLEH